METFQSFTTKIIQRQQCLQYLFNQEVDDVANIKKIAFSLATYTELQYLLSPLFISADKKFELAIEKDRFVQKILPYIEKLHLSNQYLFQKLDFDYVCELLSILSKAYSFTIPNVNVSYRKITDFTKKFYYDFFLEQISDSANGLLKDSSILFLNSNYSFPFVARNYHDAYYNDTYSIILKLNNFLDYCNLSHELFHGLHFKLNPGSIFNSIDETKELGSNMIEFLFFYFMSSCGISAGESLLKLKLLSISNESFLLNQNISSSFGTIDFVNEFLLLETKVIGYGLSREYFIDCAVVNQKLQEYIFHDFNRDLLPDYSFLGYSKEQTLSTAKRLVRERNDLVSFFN